jgi:hypothetical protein
MAWYDNNHGLTHTEKYQNAELAAKDAARALAAGWQVETEAPPRNPNTLAPHRLIVAFDTGNHLPGEIEVTYIRTPEWLHQNRRA